MMTCQGSTMASSCFVSLVVSWSRHNGKMNKLLSLLLLALAAVSAQGFAVSSGIPVMGGAVGGTSFFLSFWHVRIPAQS